MLQQIISLSSDAKASLICFFGYVISIIILLVTTKRKVHSKGIKFLPLLFLAASIVFLRAGVMDAHLQLQEITLADENIKFYLMIETLRTFAADGEYLNFINAVGATFGNSQIWYLYASVIFLAAPITGGALLIEIITSFYPRIRLVLCNRIFRWKQINYFSELNESSLALAKSIRESKNIFVRPTIVFTDVYTDSKERITELFLSAKAIGAICISDDLLHTGLRTWGKKRIFLIDTAEINNLQTLSALTENSRVKKLKNSEIYLFTDDDTFATVGYNIIERIAQKIKKNPPFVIPVNGHRNLVRNLLHNVPLYEPLVGSDNKKKILNVTIMGTGDIGTQMFLSAYWYGQILGYELYINVVSKQPEKEFRDKIDYINKDIFKTCIPSELLRIYCDKDEFAEPYFKFRYLCADLKNGDINEILTKEHWQDGFSLVKSDYFVVSLGSDENNLTVADRIKRAVCQANLNQNNLKRSIIAYVIYDSRLCKALNSHDRSRELSTGVYMRAFGSLEEVFDAKNIFMEDAKKSAEDISKSYDSIKQNAIESARGKNLYNYWSDIARASHIKYKVFSAGFVTGSIFNCIDSLSYKKAQEAAFEEYKKQIKIDKKLADNLSWLEHRRWNAYSRVCGMSCPDDFMSYARETKEHKNLDLKLHPCIVECDKKGSREDLFTAEDDAGFDMLDCASRAIYKNMKTLNPHRQKEDYKKYDYPIYDYLW